MLTAGTILSGRYQVAGRIGAGGMSDVYKAKDLVLGRFVAIKVLKSEFSEDRNFVSKFRTEAQSAAGLEHPNIVNIYDVGNEEGMYFIVMEYVEGITLKTYIEKKGQLTFRESVSIAIQVARGIESAHNKDIIHRDIKPQNIIISTEGKVKVTDFGIARAASANTISSDVMGSVHYASPEQARNGFVDERSDIYSLGIVMYEMITGRVPFDGETTVAVAIQHLQDEMVPPRKYAPNIPGSFEKIILKCTQKSPERRYQSIAELLLDLRKSLSDPNGDFVVIPPLYDNGKTKVISAQELKEIKERTASGKTTRANLVVDQALVPDPPETGSNEAPEAASQTKVSKTTGADPRVPAYTENRKQENSRPFYAPYEEDDSDEDSYEEETDEDDYDDEYEDDEYEDQDRSSRRRRSRYDSDDEDEDEDEDEDDTRGAWLNPKMEKAVTVMGIIALLIILIVFLYLIGSAFGLFRFGKLTGGQDSAFTTESETDTSDPEYVDMVNIVGMDYDQAAELLEEMGLTLFKSGTRESNQKEGYILEQDVAEGKSVEKGTVIHVTVAGEKTTSIVPGVVGYTEKAAASAITSANLTPATEFDYSDTVPAGTVISQSPEANTQASSGSTVTITISRGKKSVTVPNVTGSSETTAKGAISSAGLKCVVQSSYSDTVAAGDVISQSPASGKEVETGSSVTITVSLGAQKPASSQTDSSTGENAGSSTGSSTDGESTGGGTGSGDSTTGGSSSGENTGTTTSGDGTTPAQ